MSPELISEDESDAAWTQARAPERECWCCVL
jgi:hypothetical protein